MGLGLKFFNPANFRQMINIAKVSDGLEKHMKKECAYCGMKMGIGTEFPVVEFIDHLAEKHSDKIDAKDVESYKKVIKRLVG